MADATESGNRLKQRRASRPKVKTGCNNCKIRRVKCDESRPQCTKCVRSGRHCDGYPAYNPKNRHVNSTLPIAPRPTNAGLESKSTSSNNFLINTISSGSTSLVPREIVRIVNKAKYINPSIPTTHSTIPSIEIDSSLFRPPTLGLAFDAKEGQYFQVFRTHTASELSGFFDSEFWTRSVLQESHSEASIRHAVVALGALYKTLEKVAESPPSSPTSTSNQSTSSGDSAPTHWNFAWEQYGKAVTRMRQSQMFTRMAIQAKSYDMAFHFPAPWVIRLSTNPSIANPVASQSGPPSPSTTSSMTNLDWRYHVSQDPSLANPPSPSDSSTGTTASIEAPIPESFPNVHEARLVLDALCERIMRYNEELVGFYTVSNNILPTSIKSNGYGFGRSLEQWQATFAPLLAKRRAPGTSNTERAGMIVLQMGCIMTRILVFTAFSANEMDFDQFLPIFTEINELAKELIVDEELALAQARCGEACRHVNSRLGKGMRTPFGVKVVSPPGPGFESHHSPPRETYSHIKPSFALDLGIIPPLFVVATKCRDRRLRREAISLLTSSHRREGMWDSRLCAGVGNWIMNVEEDGLDEYVKGGESEMQFVEDGRRVMVMEIGFNLERRWAMLRCGTRGVKKGDFDPRARETPVCW
ncbi:hypothetical protein EYC80_002096 [Monilinia laxa]|uniref:Zn(2)-C6 fungal-type domain-containing protein n=1 Tax=Monilinia laxa TaxID=61186 RepID=A0A5N6K2S6_MONLA|nr:hypothetical protein EYC80_002096 [Monilinia laxa]